MRHTARIGVALMLVLAACACNDHYFFDDQSKDSLTRIVTEQSFFKDQHGRYAFFNGVNLSGSTKFPAATDPVTYVGKPFKLEEMDRQFRILRDLGFNSVRLLIMWEGIEHEGRGQYDEDYLDYLEKVVAKAGEYGIYCLLDMHQDLFSRHLFVLFNDGTAHNGLIDEREIALGKDYGFNNRVGGDGAPEWVVQACLPEKDVGGPDWGLPRNLASNLNATSDFLPFTSWYVNGATSLDVNRCWATFFAGDAVYPNYRIGGMDSKEYLQSAYAAAWAQVARRVGGYPNVLGYDVINEPGGVFIMLDIYSLIHHAAKIANADVLPVETRTQLVDGYLAQIVDRGMPETQAEEMREILADYDLVPKGLADLRASGFLPDKAGSPFLADLDAVLALNSAFNRDYLQPLHQRVGQAIQAVDPDAIIFIEEVPGLPDRGLGGQWAEPMLRPEGVTQVAFAPHGYADIYPMVGFNQPPRDFTVDEIRFRDYHPKITGALDTGTFSLGDPPMVFGEFGTYYNFGGIQKSLANDYIVSSYVLNPYYEVFDELLLSRFLWCYSPENTPWNGDGWNKEDFSVLDFNGKPRSWQAYSRTVPRFTSGRLRSMVFYSPMHYFEPVAGQRTPNLEFSMEMDEKETDAPTEVFVPPLQYPDGFYVYISDGRCAYDDERRVLYWYPSNDDPEATHKLRIRPPYKDDGDNNWNYLFRGEEVLIG